MTSTAQQRHSIRNKITLATLVISLAGIWLLAYYAAGMLHEDMQILLSDQQSSSASFMAAEINGDIKDRLRTLESVARRISPFAVGDRRDLQASLERDTDLMSLFNGGVMALDLRGIAIGDIPRTAEWIGASFMDRDCVAGAVRDGKAAICKPVIGKRLETPVIDMAVPINDMHGKIIGALMGVIDLAKPNFLDKITEARYGNTGGYLIIAPQHRLIVTASDRRRIMENLPAPGVNEWVDRRVKGYEGSQVFVNPRGVEVLSSAKAIPLAAWILVAQLPTTEAFAPISAMRERILLVTLLFTVLTGGLFWWMLRRRLSSIVTTMELLTSMSSSRLPLQQLPVTSHDEIGELVRGFNILIKTLKDREPPDSNSS